MANAPSASKKGRSFAKEIQALVKDISVEGEQVHLPSLRFEHWMEQTGKVPVPSRRAMAIEIIALAMRFEELGGKAAREIVAQLMTLATGLLAVGTKQAKKTADAFQTPAKSAKPAPKATPKKPRGK